MSSKKEKRRVCPIKEDRSACPAKEKRSFEASARRRALFMYSIGSRETHMATLTCALVSENESYFPISFLTLPAPPKKTSRLSIQELRFKMLGV